MCACSLRFPRAPPPRPPSNHSRERPFGPRDRGAAAERGARRQWGRVTCVYTVGLSGTLAVVKSVTVGPFSAQASSEKLIDEENLTEKESFRYHSAFRAHAEQRNHFISSFLPNETTKKCLWKCCIQTQCRRRFVTHPNLYVCGEFSFRFSYFSPL